MSSSPITEARPGPHFAADPVPSIAREVITLFAEALTHVRFPDMDLSVLEAAADDLRAAQVELEQIEAELSAARSALHKQAEQLTAHAQRALAYARIFAESDPALAARVESVGRTQKPAATPHALPKRRGRPAKQDRSDSSLFTMESPPVLEATC